MPRSKIYRYVKTGVLVVTAGATVYSLQDNRWKIGTIGAVRFGRAAIVVSQIAFDYKWSLWKLDAASKEYMVEKSEVHSRSANKLLNLCRANGGLFIKVGQHLASLEYLLPVPYVETLKILHSQAPKSPLSDIYKVIEEDLHAKVDELFDDFDKETLGAASLAQVHKAKIKGTKTVVAVKVQHYMVRKHSIIDMKTMEVLVRLVSLMFKDFEFMWLVDETKRNLPFELDFLNEGRNSERAAKMFHHFLWLKIPKIYWNLSSTRVLTMEFCHGGQINDQAYMNRNGINRKQVARNLGKLYSEMIFVRGYIHSDPHPGNLLVQQTITGPKIVLLDHGLYATLTDEFRFQYARLWLSIINRDTDQVNRYASRMGAGNLSQILACMVTGRTWQSIQGGIDKKAVSKSELDDISDFASKFTTQITHILNQVPREMLLVFKTNDLIRSIEFNLGTSTSFTTMSKCCIQAVYQQNKTECRSMKCRLSCRLDRDVAMTKVRSYEVFLWFRDVGRRFKGVIHFLFCRFICEAPSIETHYA